MHSLEQRKNMKRHEKGFTLIEMIGVLAVIAVLGALTAPKIFDAINDARIDTLVSDINTARSTVVEFYKDTNSFPIHDAVVTAGTPNELMANLPFIAGGTAGFVAAAPMAGWKGPYLDKKLENTINPTGNVYIYDSLRQPAGNVAGLAVSFDIDGDAAIDYAEATNVISYVAIDSLTLAECEAISNILDNDRTVGAVVTPWWSNGRVRLAGAPGAIGAAAPVSTAATVNTNTIWIYLASR